MMFSNPSLLAAFARDERTKFLLECRESFKLWECYVSDISDIACDDCEDSEGRLICELSNGIIGCTNCFSSARECSILDLFDTAVFQWKFGGERWETREYIRAFRDFKNHFSTRRYEWTRFENLGEGAISRELIDELTILQVQMQLDLAKLNFTSSVLRNSLRCIKTQAADFELYNIMSSKDAAWAMAEGLIVIRDVAGDVLDGDKENHPEAWDISLAPVELVRSDPDIRERAREFRVARGFLTRDYE